MTESELLKLAGVGPKAAKTLEDCGYNTIEKIAKTTAEELAQLPGIGKATAEKYINSAKELISKTQPTIKKTTTKAIKESESDILKESIPKPKIIKTEITRVVSSSEPKPSVRIPKTKTIEKKPEPITKPVHVKSSFSKAAQEAIKSAPEMRTIKSKKATKKTKPMKKEKISETYGIINAIVHDPSGKSKNRSVIMKLYNTEIPLSRYLGRKVIIPIPNSEKKVTGVISKLHGKKSSSVKTVIVRFNQSITPHILTAKATFA